MSASSRSYSHEHDFSAVMSFLRETYEETGSLHNWLPPRFENSAKKMAENMRIWETSEGGQEPRILAAATPEARLKYFIQVHPAHGYLIDEILEWIEGHCAAQRAEPGELKLSVVAIEGSAAREGALRRRGYQRGARYGIQRVRDIRESIPDYRAPEGFKLRSVQARDREEIARGIRVVFGHGEWFTEEVLEQTARASFYHEDLDLVAVGPNGKIASFCTFRLDAPSGVVELEPMGTLPEYRGLGLAKALLCEGFRRLERHGPRLLYIDGAADNPAANSLYEATGFTERHDYYHWNKTL